MSERRRAPAQRPEHQHRPRRPTCPRQTKNISVYLGFYDLSAKNFAEVLDIIDAYRYQCCFFVSYEEIAADADLIRRAAGEGHTIGLRLTSGTFEEYQMAASSSSRQSKSGRPRLLDGEADEAARADSRVQGLVYWHPSRKYDETAKMNFAELTDQLGAYGGGREGVNFACTDKEIYMIGSFLTYLSGRRYTVRRIVENTAPIYSVS
jgi:hypothetical protein